MGSQVENLSHFDQITMNMGPPSQSNNFYPRSRPVNANGNKINISKQKSTTSINQRQKGILRFRKPYRKQKTFTGIENENQRTGLNSILRMENDTPMTNDPTQLKSVRKIPKVPFKVLDAPLLEDDFYLNLVDWSSSNILAVGLNGAVYIWSASNQQVRKLCEVPDTDAITSVTWA